MGLKFACVYILTPLMIPAAFGQFTSMRSEMNGDTMKVTLGNPRYQGTAVRGAPYSAEQTTKHVQTLADGTHITQQKSIERIWRDSEGRMRSERNMALGPASPARFPLARRATTGLWFPPPRVGIHRS